jgi:hypothetical protein
MNGANLTLSFTVIGQRIFHREHFNVVADSINYLYVKFKFDTDWRTDPKYALFYGADRDAPPVEVLLVNNACYAPPEIIRSPCIYLSLYAVNENRRVTTELFKIPVLQSGFSADTVQPDSNSVNSVSVHSPAGERQIIQMRQAANGAVEITKDGVEWEYIKGMADEAIINVIDF